VSPELFAALGRRGGPACLHLAESPDEQRFLSSADGPWRAFLASRGLGQVAFQAAGTSAVRYADSLGILRPGLLAVHCVQADVAECRLLAERGVSVAVCPRSNRFLGVGVAPVAELLAAGVNVCVGTDSLSSSPSLDVLDDLRALHAALPGLTPAALLELATRNGARALGLADLGTLEAGKTAALAFLPAERRIKDPLAYLLHGAARATRLAA
jgi:cytosine/adenosine deaminase-related metal-dependent hydrolase